MKDKQARQEVRLLSNHVQEMEANPTLVVRWCPNCNHLTVQTKTPPSSGFSLYTWHFDTGAQTESKYECMTCGKANYNAKTQKIELCEVPTEPMPKRSDHKKTEQKPKK